MTAETINQNLVINASTIYDGTEVNKKILRNIKNFGEGLDDKFKVEVEYPEIEDVDIYYMVLNEGTVDITQGSVLNMTFSLTMTKQPEEEV